MFFKLNSLLLFSCILLSSCEKGKDLYPATHLGAHAGAGLHISSSIYHDNSLNAVNYALSFDEIKMIEVDIQLSKNHTWWLFHDIDLNEETNGKGKIQFLTDDEISQIKYTSINRESLCRLTDLPVDLAGKTLILDLRETDGTEFGLIDSTAMISSLQKVVEHFNQQHLVVVSATGRYLETLKQLGFEVYLNAQNALDFFQMNKAEIASGAFFRNSTINETDIRSLAQNGKKSVIYDVRSPKGIKNAFKKQPFCVLTDDIPKGIIEKFK